MTETTDKLDVRHVLVNAVANATGKMQDHLDDSRRGCGDRLLSLRTEREVPDMRADTGSDACGGGDTVHETSSNTGTVKDGN